MNTDTWSVPDDGTPLEVYHSAWKEIKDRIYEPQRSWRSWEHRFDREISTVDDAVRCTKLMLNSLGDRYTRLMSSDEVREETWLSFGRLAGIGVAPLLKRDRSGVLKFDRSDSPLLETDNSGYPFIRLVQPNLPAAAAGLKAGDAIVSVDGISTPGGSSDSLSAQILGLADTEVEIVVKRGDSLITASVKRQSLVTEPVQSKLLAGNIGYIKLADFSALGAMRKVMEAFRSLREAEALIIDLRNNPGGTTSNAVELAAMFLPAGKVVTIKSRIADSGNIFGRAFQQRVITLTDNNAISAYKLVQPFRPTHTDSEKQLRVPYMVHGRPVVILVNEGTASASEMFTGAVRDNGHATVIGSRTFGKGIGQIDVQLPLGTKLLVTTCRYFTPSGAWLGDGGNTISQGITPDFIVQLDNPFIELGSDQDNQLAYAVGFLMDRPGKR